MSEMRKGFAPEVEVKVAAEPESVTVPAEPAVPAMIPAGPAEPEAPATMPVEGTSNLPSPWEPAFERVVKVLALSVRIDKRTATGAHKRKLRGARDFIGWLDSKGFTPDARPVDALDQWLVTVDIPRKGGHNINQLLTRSGAILLLTEEDNMRNNRPLPPRAVIPAPVDESGLAEEEDDRDDGDDAGAEGEEFAPEDPSPRKTARYAAPPAQPQPVYIPVPVGPGGQPFAPGFAPGFNPYAPPRNRGGRPPTNPNHPNYRPPPQSAVSKLLPRNDKIRVWKRHDDGRRTIVHDYTLDDIGGGSLPKFLKEFVAPTFGNPSGVTVFEVFEVGPDDKERGQPSSITIETEPEDGGNDPLQPARSALSFIEDVRQLEEARRGSSQEILDDMKRKAGHGGDMNQMMMLMMMERLMGSGAGNPEQLALKLVERLQQGGGVAMAPVSVPMGPSPSSALDKVVEALLANSLKPTPPPKTLIEQMGELKMLMSVLAPPPPVAPAIPPELIQLLARMNEKLDKPRGGLEEAVGTFGRLKDIVKTLAPEVNAGGITGALQSILTPELGKAIGNVVADGIEKAKGSQKEAQRPPAQRTVAGAAVPTAPVATNPAPTTETPQAIRDAAKKLAEEKDELKAQGALVELLQAMYTEPSLAKRLDEPLGAVLTGNYTPARGTLKEILLSAQRADLTTPVFIDRSLAMLIARAGGTPPDELLHKATVTPIRPAGYIPSVAESEALEKAEREAKVLAKAPAANNGTAATPNKDTASPAPEQHQPSNIA